MSRFALKSDFYCTKLSKALETFVAGGCGVFVVVVVWFVVFLNILGNK